MLSRRARLGLLLAIATVATAGTFALPRIAQDPGYHAFADTRTIAGIPNFWNVVSNAGFVAVGAAGMWWLLRGGRRSLSSRRELLTAFVFATGVLLIGLGSAWYHLAPDHGRLVWDRLPMTLAFMSLFALVIGDRVGAAAGAWLLLPLLAIGVASVVVWHVTESAGRGDLRLYGLVQFLPLLLVPLLLILLPARHTGVGWLWAALALNGAGKLTELADARVLAITGFVSGHTVKHVVMAAATGLVLVMVAVRRPR